MKDKSYVLCKDIKKLKTQNIPSKQNIQILKTIAC